MENSEDEEYISTLNRKREALKIAHDIRKFEIDLYWKRATYFWAFIASIFAGFLVLLTAKNTGNLVLLTTHHPSELIPPFKLYLLLIASMGLIFSFAWYCVNRGSKHWQENWEIVIKKIEFDITGGLLANHIKNNTRFLNFLGSYPFSVSKINQLLSLAVTFFWLIIWGVQLYPFIDMKLFILFSEHRGALGTMNIIASIAIVGTCGSLFWIFLCKSKNKHLNIDDKNIENQKITYKGLFYRKIEATSDEQ